MIVHVLHVGKTGGTALTHGLRPYLDSGPYSILLHGHETTLRDVPRREKIVFFLRHPVDRFVSGFYSRQRQGRPRLNVPWSAAEAIAFAQFETANDLALGLSSSDPEHRRQAIDAMNGIGHVRDSVYKWIGSDAAFRHRAKDILFIGFQEQFEEDFRRLKAILHIPDEAALPRDDIAAHRNPQGVDRRLDELARVNLLNWYHQDVEFYERCVALRNGGLARDRRSAAG